MISNSSEGTKLIVSYTSYLRRGDQVKLRRPVVTEARNQEKGFQYELPLRANDEHAVAVV
jgi:hypothetical protein